MGKSDKVDFSETIAASDLKVGRCRQLIELMKVCEYWRLLRDGQNKHVHVRNSSARGVSFGQIQHLRGLNSIALGYLNFTAGLT